MKDEHLKIKIRNHEPLNDSDMWSSSDCFLPQQQKQRGKKQTKTLLYVRKLYPQSLNTNILSNILLYCKE